jgi:hypothetical protein
VIWITFYSVVMPHHDPALPWGSPATNRPDAEIAIDRLNNCTMPPQSRPVFCIPRTG